MLSTLCQADVPPGLRPHIIRFFLYLVGHIPPDQVILPYVTVYLPMRRLLAIFCSSKASPTESQELAFIVSLVAHLKRKPEFNIFFGKFQNRFYIFLGIIVVFRMGTLNFVDPQNRLIHII